MRRALGGVRLGFDIILINIEYSSSGVKALWLAGASAALGLGYGFNRLQWLQSDEALTAKTVKLIDQGRSIPHKVTDDIYRYSSRGRKRSLFNAVLKDDKNHEVVCRHYMWHFAQQHDADYSKALTRQSRLTAELLANHYDKDRIVLRADRQVLVPAKKLGEGLLHFCKGMKVGDDSVMTIGTLGHAMSAVVRRKASDKWVVKFYDSNSNGHDRLFHERFVLSHQDAIADIRLTDTTSDMLGKLSYWVKSWQGSMVCIKYYADTKHLKPVGYSQAFEVIAGQPVPHDHPQLLAHAALNGVTKDIDKVVEAALYKRPLLPSVAPSPFIYSNAQGTYHCILPAVLHQQAGFVQGYMRGLLVSTNLSDQEKKELIVAKSLMRPAGRRKFSVSALGAALALNAAPIVSVFFDELLKSSLSSASIFEIIKDSVDDVKGLSYFASSLIMNNTAAATAFIIAIATADESVLSTPQKIELLSFPNTIKNEKATQKYIDIVLSIDESVLPDEKKMGLLKSQHLYVKAAERSDQLVSRTLSW